jgi:cobalt-zinc-cadmium efflux system outer membrane protein
VPGELTLPAALRLALRHNPRLVASAWGIRGAQGTRRDAGRWINPSLGVEVENFGGDLGQDSRETTVAAGQVVELGGDRGARAAVAEGLIQSATSGFKVDQLEVLEGTTADFLLAWVAQQRLVRLRNAERVAEEAVAAADQRFRAGAAHSVDRLRAEGNLAVRMSERRQAEAELTTSRRALAVRWGSGEATFDSLRLDPPNLRVPPSADSLLDRLDTHPAVERAASEVAVASAGVRAARAARIPDLEAVAGVRRLEDADATGLVAGLSVPMPLWNTGGGALRAAEAERSAAEARKVAVRRQLEEQLRSARERLIAAIESYGRVAHQLLPSAREALEQLRAGYRAGRFSYLDLLEGQRSALEAELFELEVAKDVWSARVALERLTGRALESGAQPQEEE